MPIVGWIVLAAFVSGLATWIFFQPIVLGAVAGFAVLIWMGVLLEKNRIQKIKSQRSDNICDFRRSFDCQAVDPWIIRAAYEELGKYLDGHSGFPLRADDDFEKDLKIDGEDLDDLAYTVAARIGYDMTASDQNPLFGRVKTVRDFVMFFTHQPKIKKTEQTDAANPRAFGTSGTPDAGASAPPETSGDS